MAQSAIGFGGVAKIKAVRSGVDARCRGANKEVGQRKRYKAVGVVHSGRGPPSLKCANQNPQQGWQRVLPHEGRTPSPPEEQSNNVDPPQQPGGYGYPYPPYNQDGYPYPPYPPYPPPGYPQQAAYPYSGYPQYPPQQLYPHVNAYPQYYYPPQQPYPHVPYAQYYYPPQQPYPPPARQSKWPTIADVAALAGLVANAYNIVSGISDTVS